MVVTCNSQDLQARDFIENPQLIVEVLSPGTSSYDRGDEFKFYRQFASLQEYVLVDSETISVEIYQRSEGRLWLYSAYTEGETINLSSIGLECRIEQLYEAVMLEKRDNSNIPLG